MDEHSKANLEGKLNALEKGDEAVQNRVGMGKDIMSILREYMGSFVSVSHA